MTTSATRRPTRGRRRPKPSRSVENALLAELGHGGCVVGMDEVGRGALAGPVSVGVAVVNAGTSRRMPRGLADSKLLTAGAREALVAPVRTWCVAAAVGHAEPAEIDAYGIMAGLRLAGRRALAQVVALGVEPGLVLLDGNHDWLASPVQADLFAAEPPPVHVPGTTTEVAVPPVRTQIKADATCAVVAAASVVAKVERDARMVELDPTYPRYGWAGNKGYSAPEHLAALREHGPCELHRRSWNLPSQGQDPYGAALDEFAGDPDDLAEVAEAQELADAEELPVLLDRA
ncbi:ribonuclease HII [Georgenia alba]|uniref:Ribonuclease n=1 Tax=Georgenia alba TaxID=2233858 RepID=A0ABW2Q913_9MICO